MLKSVVKQGLILLVIALAVMIAYVIHHNRRANVRTEADQILAVGGTYVIDGKTFLVVDANQSAAAVGAIATRDKVFYLVDPNQPATPWYFSPVKWPSSCRLASDPNLGLCLQSLEDYTEKSRRKSRYSAAERWRVKSKRAAAKQQSSKKAAARE